MSALLSLGIGYFIGCINPAAWIGKKKHIDLSKEGTKNLGATNTALVLGKKAGYFVLLFDMLKSIFSYRVAKLIFSRVPYVGMIAGIGVLIGHCFPVFMNFQGGKGLASFGGLVLAHDPVLFAMLLTLGIGAAFAMNYGVYLAVTATVLFPITSYLRSRDLTVCLMAAVASGIILIMHKGNLGRAIRHEDPIHVRDGLHKIFGKKK